jgi:4-amino-4-deoxy-L-arabinose transferase-like glycosyltransferase
MSLRPAAKKRARGKARASARPASRIGDFRIAIGVAIATVILLAASAPSIGVTWDEPVYISTAKSYVSWFAVLLGNPQDALSRSTIDLYWSRVHEHPPGERIVSGLVWLAARHVFDDLLAIRLGPIVMVGLLAALVFLLVAGSFGRMAGLYAVAALLSMPRFFFHAHLAAQDVPVTVVAFAVVFLFWKTVDRPGWIWGLFWGLAWGLALLFKIPAIMVPIALAIWCYFFRTRWLMATRLVLMGLGGVLTFVLLWPWLFFDTYPRLLEYTNRFIQYGPLGVWYFGEYVPLAPWHFGPVMIWAVVPLTTLGLFVLGASRAGDGKRDAGLVWLLLIGGLASIGPFIRDGSLVFDNDRFFMPVFPYIAALAGIGFGKLLGLLGRAAMRVGRPDLLLPGGALVALALLIPQAVGMVRLYPHLLSYYSEGVGGLRGATRLGLETTYWCETYGAAITHINTHGLPGDKIWVERASQDVLVYYQSIGRLRADVNISFEAEFPMDADWYVYQHRQSQTRGVPEESYPPHAILKKREPVYQLQFEGIPLMSLYGRLR